MCILQTKAGYSGKNRTIVIFKVYKNEIILIANEFFFFFFISKYYIIVFVYIYIISFVDNFGFLSLVSLLKSLILYNYFM